MENHEKQFAELGRILFSKAASHMADGECDEWGEELMEEALKLGLARREPFDPAKHGPVEAEPGDTIWAWDHLPSLLSHTLRFLNPATGQEEPDLNNCGVLVRTSDL